MKNNRKLQKVTNLRLPTRIKQLEAIQEINNKYQNLIQKTKNFSKKTLLSKEKQIEINRVLANTMATI